MDTDFYKFIKRLSDNRENHLFLNSKKENMPLVFDVMFHQSKSEFRIFAGSLCNDITNNPIYVESMSDFIEAGGSLMILLNNFQQEKVYESKVFRRLYMYIKQGKDIKVRKTSDSETFAKIKKKLNVHFSVGDKECFRLENDIVKQQAICNMNDPEMAESLASLFDVMFEETTSKKVDLIEIFERG